MRRFCLFALLVVTGASLGADPPTRHRGEFLQLLDAVMTGSMMGPGDGWFKPAQTRFTWDRLRARYDKNGDGRITASEFDGLADLFAVLDRDGDGAIRPDDLDWSDSSTYARQLGHAQQFLRPADTNGNRKISKDEWMAYFEKMTKGSGDLEPEMLRKFLYPPPPPPMPKSAAASGMPSKEVLLFGLLTGELGSGAEGPKVDAAAPDFTLETPDGKTSITLSKYLGKQPVVLIFGSFT
jgi:EF hand